MDFHVKFGCSCGCLLLFVIHIFVLLFPLLLYYVCGICTYWVISFRMRENCRISQQIPHLRRTRPLFFPISHPKRLLPLPPGRLYKQQSWSPNSQAEEVWAKLKANQRRNRQRSKNVTDDDLTELKACFELGFGFETDTTEVDRRLSDVFPALELYRVVNRISRSSSSSSIASLDSDSIGSYESVIDLDGGPETVKTKLKQWAQLVACSIRLSPSST